MLFPAANFRAFKFTAHEALDGENRALGVGNSLALGDIANQTFLICKGDHGRSGTATFGIGDALGVLALHDVDAGVRGTQVDAYNLGHI